MIIEQHKQALTKQSQQFLHQFEQLTLPASQFNHLGHLRIAWLYILLAQQAQTSRCEQLNCAQEKVCSGIKAYATSLGAAGKFHLTVTRALVIIVESRMDALKEIMKVNALNCNDWPLFIEKNPDLVNSAIDVLRRFYSQSILDSDEAKLSWCEPDIRPF